MTNSAFSGAYSIALQQLKDGRRSAGLTQARLSSRLGMPQPFISKVEHGVRRIDVVEFCAIALAIGLDPRPMVDQILTAIEQEGMGSEGK